MATAPAPPNDVTLQELNCLKEEYVKLQSHLEEIELKYQSVIGEGGVAGNDDGSFVSQLQTVVSELFTTQLYSDVRIQLENGRQFYGHKFILSARSVYWGVADLVDTEVLNLSDINYDVTMAMLKWVYTDKLDATFDDGFLKNLLQVAARFHLEPLLNRVEKLLITHITQTNCQELYDMSKQLHCILLKNYCLEFLLQHKKKNPPQDANSQGTDNEMIGELADDSFHGDSGVDENLFTSKRMFQCKQCPKRFHKSYGLKRHESTHTGLRPFKCDHCNKTYTDKSTMQKHIKNVHLKVDTEKQKGSKSKPLATKLNKVLQCDFCNAKYSNKSQLARHRLKHTGETPYKCDLCDRTFRHRVSQRVHRRTHTGEKPYQCEGCGRFFAEKCQLRQHSRIHTGAMPFVCTTCDRPFRHRESLVVHLRLHSDERPYVCDVCGKSFRTSGGLQVHIRIHTGEKPYACEICQKGFKDASHMRRHRKIHDKEKNPDNETRKNKIVTSDYEALDISQLEAVDINKLSIPVRETITIQSLQDRSESEIIAIQNQMNESTSIAIQNYENQTEQMTISQYDGNIPIHYETADGHGNLIQIQTYAAQNEQDTAVVNIQNEAEEQIVIIHQTSDRNVSV